VADPRPSARMGRRVVDPPEDLGTQAAVFGAAATRWCRSASGGTSRRRCQARAQLELNHGHVPQLENSPRDRAAVLGFLSAPEGSEVAAAAEVPAAEAAAEVPAAELPEVAAADRVLDSPVGGIGITETAEGTAEHRADE
jgi:hypothetical protein